MNFSKLPYILVFGFFLLLNASVCAKGNVGIGTNVPVNTLDVAGGIVIGSANARVNTSPANRALFQGSISIGKNSASALLDVNVDAVINGITAGRGSGNIDGNVTYGSLGLPVNTSGQFNTALECGALFKNTTANDNTATGYNVVYNNTTGSNNTGSGTYALSSTSTGSGNSAYSKNTLLSNTMGSNNTALGTFADVAAGNLTNATTIGFQAKVGACNSLVLGGTGANAVIVAIGITTPSQALDVNGLIRMRSAAGADYIPVSDDNGLMTWTSPYAISTGIYSSQAVVSAQGFLVRLSMAGKMVQHNPCCWN